MGAVHPTPGHLLRRVVLVRHLLDQDIAGGHAVPFMYDLRRRRFREALGDFRGGSTDYDAKVPAKFSYPEEMWRALKR
jgi:hypothetical protein